LIKTRYRTNSKTVPDLGANVMIRQEQCKSEAKRLRRNGLDLIEYEHRIQSQICDGLERIADGLPNDVDRGLCEQVVKALRYEIPLHHRDEECGLFPLIDKRALPNDDIHDILARLALEHATDESFAGELLESLQILANGGKVNNPNMVGYMLRSFFESYRRHIQWENAVVLPLARSRLTEEDVEELEQAMSHNREFGSLGWEAFN
jgi:hemerythrin-like domain-containing protein